MVNFMLKADLCISGGGQTTYELARVGVPTIGICFAENQLNNLIYGQKEGYLEFAGWFDDKELLVRIEEFLMDLNYEKRVKMKKFGEKSVDGRGVRRLLKAI
jgi:spore coat polysaccharide biosynthesis predicted glycosyltransferase SpsG